MFNNKKRWIESLLWIGALTIHAITIATTKIMEAVAKGEEAPAWKPLLTEFSSIFIILLLIPCILYIDQRIPIASKDWPKRLLIHLPLSLLFSLIHILGMFAIRSGVYMLQGESLVLSDPSWIILFEYRKDFGTYFTILVAIYAYREIIRLRSGEAQLATLDKGNDKQRILVSKRGLFHFIEPDAIHWVEAAGNYVELHVDTETYMLRSTMKEIENRLGKEKFSRIHRSSIVNRDQVASISPAINGDKIVSLHSGKTLRLSRRYRHSLNGQASR